MGHPVLAIISYAEQVDQQVYPQPQRSSTPVPFLLWSGERPLHTAQARSLEVLRQVQGQWQVRATLQKITARIDVTSARTVLTCRDFDKGSRWIGSPGAMLLFNAGSMIAAAVRRQNRVLAGQLRHEWLSDVGFHSWPPLGWSTPGVSMGWRDDEGLAALRLILRSSPDPRGLADTIATAATADRLSRGVLIPSWPGLSGFSLRQAGAQRTGHATIPCPLPATAPGANPSSAAPDPTAEARGSSRLAS